MTIPTQHPPRPRLTSPADLHAEAAAVAGLIEQFETLARQIRAWSTNLPDRYAGTDWATPAISHAVAGFAEHAGRSGALAEQLSVLRAACQAALALGQHLTATAAAGDLSAYTGPSPAILGDVPGGQQVTCDGCARPADDGDQVLTFASRADAITVLTCGPRAWRINFTKARCDVCLDRDACARDGHDWTPWQVRTDTTRTRYWAAQVGSYGHSWTELQRDCRRCWEGQIRPQRPLLDDPRPLHEQRWSEEEQR